MLSRRDYLKAIAALTAVGMTGVARAAKAEFNLKFGHTGAPNHHYQAISQGAGVGWLLRHLYEHVGQKP